MQKTRQKIVEYLREHETATVDELSAMLNNLTAVTVRHHLDVLRGEGLVSQPEVQHRDSPGRPRYVYRLTDDAERLFPKNYGVLVGSMLEEMSARLSSREVNVMFDGVATRMADGMPPGQAGEPLADRLDRVVRHLVAHGYEASWEDHPEGYLLHTGNCPYSTASETHDALCKIDMTYVAKLIGRVPRRVGHILEGDSACSYLIPQPT